MMRHSECLPLEQLDGPMEVQVEDEDDTQDRDEMTDPGGFFSGCDAG
jgi:hypothetical protein